MPIRRSEAYDDPLKQKSHEKLPVPGKISEAKSVSLQEAGIQWSNLIFLPFHPIFEMFIVFGVCIKVVLGPIQAVYPIVYCSELMEKHSFLTFIKYFYLYFCDSLYGIDTFLHIVHRQVTDKAMRREHLPKSAGLLLIDIISLIPMFHLTSETCPPVQLWPNILAFNEYLVIYRIGFYFSLVTTHSYKNLLSGYTIVLLMTLNCVTCFWLLLTAEGLCENCKIPGKYYDWRDFIKHKLNETDEGYGTYIYAFSFVFSFTENSFYSDEIIPTTMVEFYICCLFAIICYICNHFLLTPKFFGEALMRLRWICTRYPITQKIIEDTKRRNVSKNAHKKVEEYYVTIWRKQKGIHEMPSIYDEEIPRYLRLEIKQDLLWPIFYHSPTLRKTSLAIRRWLSDFIIISYKMPGERFFTGADSSGTLYYLKSGIVELLSTDDGTTPILSVTSGTIFGDTNFYTPNNNRKVITRCLTFCEIYYVKRSLFIRALHRYPSDRNIIMRATHARLEHAKKLYSCKALIRGIDRNEDEGIAWIKRRWWEIHDVVQKWSRQSGKTKEQVRCDLPREESIYHCAKYIGQLVLCAPSELQTQSMFTRYSFPWILNPISNFGHAWYRIVAITVLLVLCTFPTNLVKPVLPVWFVYFTFYSDTVYILDIGVSLFTAVDKLDMSTDGFATVMFERFKTFTFLLDVISTLWFEDIFSIAGTSEAMYNTLQFNRLLKCYVLFRGVYLNWDLIIKNPFVVLCRKLILTYFTIQMVCSHVILDMSNYMTLNMKYFFGEIMCIRTVKSDCRAIHPVVGVLVAWEFEWVFCEFSPENLPDMYVGMFVTFMNFVLFIFNKGNFVSYMYLKYRCAQHYQIFVSNLKKYYEHYKIHLDLLKRLDRYFICHWKYYQGADVMYSNSLKDEPTEVYWKAQGEVAQTVIGESGAFTHADPALIRELACEAKFLVLPKLTNLVMFGIPCKNVTWIVQGYVKSEHYDETGELLITYYGPGNMLAISSVFFGRVSLSTYSTYTDCEAIFIPIHRFFEIYKRYKIEYEFLQVCTTEFGRQFDEMFKKCILKHRDYQHKLRDRIYSTRMSMVATSKVMPDIQEQRSLPFEGELWGDPESRFMQSWLTFRCIIVYVSIASAAVLGGIGAVSRWVFTMISGFCDCISWIDIIMKLCMPYYDNRGILITDRQKCFLNYASKAFVLDVIGAVPWFDVIKSILESEIDDDTSFLMNTLCKFAHIYIIFAYFQYISDIPTVNGTFINIIKWQLVNSLVVLGASHYFMVSCVKFDFESKSMRLLEVTLRNTCWMPDVIQLPIDLSWDDLHLIFAESLSLAENGMLGLHFGRFIIDRENIGVGICLMFIGFLYWFISAYSLTLLVLDVGGDYEFQHSVNQLEHFLKSERVDKAIIERSVLHFKYSWKRTMGVELAQLNNESINTVFRQDLNSYFYRKTFSILDSILKGGEQMQRQLASNSIIHFFLPGHDIFREQNMIDYLCVVHRGRVALSKNGQKLITLSKGDIFGQLLGTKVRPVRVTATAEDFVDVLHINLKAFQSTITEPVRRTITRNPQQKSDFMATKNIFVENPYDTVQYLLRGRKTIRFPWSRYPTEARGANWYVYFLHLTWFVGPLVTAMIVHTLFVLPTGHNLWVRMYVLLFIFDAVHLINFLSEFYEIELVVLKNKCAHQRVGLKIFKRWGLYVDLLTFLIPLGTIVNNDWRFQYGRILRLKSFWDFHRNFCKSFKRQLTPVILKISIILLIMHSFTCGWVYIACRREGKFPVRLLDVRNFSNIIDLSMWMHPDDRGEGCARVSRDVPDKDDPEVFLPTFVVPRHWAHDYVLAFTYILMTQTLTNLDTVMPLTINEVYYKVFMTFVLQLVDLYVMAMALNFARTKYREQYLYDAAVKKMLIYLNNCGLCKSLSDSILAYTHQLWDRQKGERLPDLAYKAPTCLRHDLFSELYIHHLEAPATFRQLPYFFKRQLAARLNRMTVFPGKCIVREGDTFNVTYFIHEGEVEKYQTDKNGESKLISVLYTNGYFGCVSGLFVNVGFYFSYYSRTVVDLVYLHLDNWSDLLECYPEVKMMLYESTKAFRSDVTKTHPGRSAASSIVY
nr:uncharacterized protein LOC110381372 isoform X2 [Helicoverpa armigera]